MLPRLRHYLNMPSRAMTTWRTVRDSHQHSLDNSIEAVCSPSVQKTDRFCSETESPRCWRNSLWTEWHETMPNSPPWGSKKEDKVDQHDRFSLSLSTHLFCWIINMLIVFNQRCQKDDWSDILNNTLYDNASSSPRVEKKSYVETMDPFPTFTLLSTNIDNSRPVARSTSDTTALISLTAAGHGQTGNLLERYPWWGYAHAGHRRPSGWSLGLRCDRYHRES